jgi:hypothetical protein
VRRTASLCQVHNHQRSGAPGVIRTLDLVLRRHTLYPAELRARRAVPLILKHFSIPQQSVSSSIGQAWSEPLRLDGMHFHRRLLAALVILLGGMYEFWRTGRVTGLELLLGPDSGGI